MKNEAQRDGCGFMLIMILVAVFGIWVTTWDYDTTTMALSEKKYDSYKFVLTCCVIAAECGLYVAMKRYLRR